MQITFTVWQFVRVMVYLEAHPRLGAAQGLPPLLEAWHDIWEPLDQELGELAEEDFSAYADLMMDQQVEIDQVQPAHASACAEALKAVAEEIGAQIEQGGDIDIEHLEFEKSELTRLAETIRANT